MHFLLVCNWKRFRGFVGREVVGEEPWTRQGGWGGDGEGEFGVLSPSHRGPGRDERGRRD